MNTSVDNIDAKLQDISALETVFERAALDAMRRHALNGNEIVVWQDEQIVVEVPKLEDFPAADEAS